MTLRQVLLTACACIGVVLGSLPRSRSLMMWLAPRASVAHPDPESEWKARIANITAHRENLTGVSPVIHGIDAAGRFSNQGQTHYDWVAPYLPPLKALGLDIIPIIYLTGGVPGLQHVVSTAGSKAFIDAAVKKALEMKYDGYNIDNEARGGPSNASWAYLLPYAKPWMDFLDKFADAMHVHNKTLSVFIAGCCGWVDTQHKTAPAGHCQGAFADFEFVATTCPMYSQSRLDAVYGGGTYSDSIWNKSSPYGPSLLKTMTSSSSKAIGLGKYGYGFKGGWSLPAESAFEETARDTLDYLRDTVGIRHVAHWVNEPYTQAQWDMWGYFLHSDASTAGQQISV